MKRKQSHSTYAHKRIYPRPSRVVRTLPPSPLMHDRALVRTPAQQVDQQRDPEDDAEHTAGAEGAAVARGYCAAAGVPRAHLEEIGARVGRADEGDGGVRGEGRVPVAEEGEQGGLVALGGGLGGRG